MERQAKLVIVKQVLTQFMEISVGISLVMLAIAMLYTTIRALPDGTKVVVNSSGTYEVVLDFAVLGFCILSGTWFAIRSARKVIKDE